MLFDYEKNLWGKESATLSLFSPTYFRLKKALSILKKTPAGENVLDFGCGVGRFARAFKNLRPDLNVYGCDISEEAIKSAKQTNDGAEYEVIYTGRKTRYADGTFENIFIFDVLEHLENPAFVLQDLKRILKNGGTLFLQVPCEKDWLSLWYWLDKVGLKKDLTKNFAGHVNFWSRSGLNDLLLLNGFKIKKKYYADHFLGQLAGTFAFYETARQARRKKLAVYNNEKCMSELKENRGMGWSFLGKTVNLFINLEDMLWQKIPSSNVFYILGKNE